MPRKTTRMTMPRMMGKVGLPTLAALLAVGLWVRPAQSRDPSAYHATGAYDVYVDYEMVESAELLHSVRTASYLLLLPERDDAFLLQQRSRSVAKLPASAVERRDDGYVEIANGAEVETLGRFGLAGADVVVSVEGLTARLKPRPPHLGAADREAMLAHMPEYAIQMRAYRLDPGAIGQLKQRPGKIEVEVFFGSWCSRCKSLLGNMLRVDEALEGSNVTIRYYGLPPPPAAWQEPHYQESGIHGLPTAVVKVDGRQRGLIEDRYWTQLEAKLLELTR